MPLVHTLPVRVYYEDTDFSGVVYHANYLRFFERGRSELLRDLGLHHRALFEGAYSGARVGFVVRAMRIEFKAPARMDDLVDVETEIREVRGASAHMDQRIRRDGAVLVTAHVRVAVVASGRAVRFPPEIREALLRALA
jgi:acyl-CoA thioester hydrolase